MGETLSLFPEITSTYLAEFINRGLLDLLDFIIYFLVISCCFDFHYFLNKITTVEK